MFHEFWCFQVFCRTCPNYAGNDIIWAYMSLVQIGRLKQFKISTSQVSSNGRLEYIIMKFSLRP